MKRSLVFLVDLVQDVNILRPLILFAKENCGLDSVILVSKEFYSRDKTQLWASELQEICARADAPILDFESAPDAARKLSDVQGIAFSASESTVSYHAICHAVFRALPSSFLKVTLQHGFECVGFLHNRAHDHAYGNRVAFAADVICGWFGRDVLRSVQSDQKPKLFVSGPPMLLDPQFKRKAADVAKVDMPKSFAGLVCENLHSVRMVSSGLQFEFLKGLDVLAAEAKSLGGAIWLRPHPAGRFVGSAPMADAISMSTGPLYKSNLSQFSFCISSPSSILFDCVLAGVPVGIWRDRHNAIDSSNYDGLYVVSDPAEWGGFARLAVQSPRTFLEPQARFLADLEVPDDVPSRYAALLRAF